MDDQQGTGLPASFEVAWGLRGRPPKGPKPGLSVERIVDAAVQIAAAEGLSAVSMSRVAADLGTSAMTLYRYIAAKDELLALMTDAALPAPPDPIAEGEAWRQALSRWAFAMLTAYGANGWVLRIPIKGPPITPNQIAWLEVGLQALRDTNLTEHEKLSTIMVVTGLVRTEATLALDMGEAFKASDDNLHQYGRMLSMLIDPVRFPALTVLVGAGLFDGADEPEVEFVYGLERMLDGIDALITARGSAGTGRRSR